MLPLDIHYVTLLNTTRMVSKLRTRYNYMRKPTHTFTRKKFICGDFHEKSTDETTKALFPSESYFVFIKHFMTYSLRDKVLLVYYSKNDHY